MFPFGETAIIFRKQDRCTLYEVFELNPVVADGALEKLIRWYPELAIEIPDEVFHDEEFQSELANFFRCMNDRSSELNSYEYSQSTKYGSIKLLSGISHAVGRPAEITPISKRVVRRVPTLRYVWDRSEEWFLVKVAIQLSLDRSSLGRATYKMFMLFFMLNLANHAAGTCLSSDLLHLMSAKIIRRFRKLGTSVPKWLADAVMQTCTRLSDILDNRCMRAQIVQHASLPWNPLRLDLDLTLGTQLSLHRCSKYLSSSLVHHGTNPHNPPVFHHPIRGTLHNFLSSRGMFFKEACHQDPHMALCNVEKAVEQEIDIWTASITDVDEACVQIETLIEDYLFGVQCISGISVHRHIYDPEHFSIKFLTMIELWVALDKLVLKKIPILTNYSPEIPMDPFDRLLFRKTTNLHRFIRAHQYISARHAESQPGLSVFSQEFTEHSFPVRYYDSSPQIQDLESRVEGNVLPTNPLHAKVVLFELQCPVRFELWRSATIRLLDFCYSWKLFDNRSNLLSPGSTIPIAKVPDLQCFIRVNRHQRALISLAYREDQLLYVIYNGDTIQELPEESRIWDPQDFAYKIPSGLYSDLQGYLTSTTHTSNQVLSAQVYCHADISLHEFIAFGHLRSGGSLQWMNILREVCNRSLNFRCHEVHLLLAQASAQVGPLSSTGEFIWHRELQDSLFCDALLDELESLFLDSGAGSSDGPVMGTISILVGLLVSGPSEAVLERASQLLRSVREKTFDWVNEFFHDVIKSPTNEECRQVLWDMAVVCRSTFDVEPSMMHKFLHSARDIEIALACAILMRTIVPTNIPG